MTAARPLHPGTAISVSPCSMGSTQGSLESSASALSSSVRRVVRTLGWSQKCHRSNLMLADAAAMMLHKIIDKDNAIVKIG